MGFCSAIWFEDTKNEDGLSFYPWCDNDSNENENDNDNDADDDGILGNNRNIMVINGKIWPIATILSFTS